MNVTDRLGDRHAAPPFSGTLLNPARVAAEMESLLNRPRPVLAVPRWRGGVARLTATFPRGFLLAMPSMLVDACRRQRRWKQRIEAGRNRRGRRGPPPPTHVEGPRRGGGPP